MTAAFLTARLFRVNMFANDIEQMFEKSPDQLAGLKVQMMDKTAYCNQRHIILLDDTAKNLKEGKWHEYFLRGMKDN